MALKTFFSDIASRGPFLITGEEAYLVSPNPGTNYVGFNDSQVKLGLVPAGSLSNLVRTYKSIFKDDIYVLKKKFIEKKADYGFQTAEERKKDIGNRKLFSFIIKDLMPYLSGHKEDISELLGEEVRRQAKKDKKDVDEKELLATTEKVNKDLYDELEKYGIKQFEDHTQDEASYLRQILGESPILTLNKTVYKLDKAAKQKSQIASSIDGEISYAKLVPIAEISEIEKQYSKFIEWKARGKAVDEFSDYIRQVQMTRLETIKDFEKVRRLKDFNDGDIGFLKRDDSVYIYQIIPPFAMLDPRPVKKDVSYEFPKLRVGMEIEYDDNKIHLYDPQLFEAEWHPFVREKHEVFQTLCGGQIPSRNGSEVEWVAKALDDAKNLIMHGLTPKSIRNHDGDRESGGKYFGTELDDKLGPRKISINKARKKGLLITNRWDWDND